MRFDQRDSDAEEQIDAETTTTNRDTAQNHRISLRLGIDQYDLM